MIPDINILQTVFDSAPNGIAVMEAISDKAGKVEDFSILLFNAYTLNWIGNIDYKGKRYGDVFPMVKETGILKRFIEVAETGVTARFERFYNGEGMHHWFHFTAVKQGSMLVVTTEDITERKLAEIGLTEALEATGKLKHLYDSMINTTPDLVYMFDLSYRFTYANKALLNMWGKSAEDAIGKGLRDNGYEEWHALMHEREIDDVVANKKSIRGTVSFPHAEFGKRIYDYIFVPLMNEKGEVEAIAGSTRDITEFKKTEEDLQQSEARFRNMIEQSPVAILLSKGEDVVVESVNEPMLRFMNKAAARDVLGKPILEVLPELAGQPALETVIKVQKTGIPFQGDEQPVDLIYNGQLERRYFNFSYNSIKEPGGGSAVLHMAIDVTEQVRARRRLEESESQLKSVIDQTPAPTLVLRGDDLILTQVNDTMLQMIGYGKEAIGRPLIELLPELKGQYIWEQVLKVYREGVPFDQWEVKVPHKRTGVMVDYYYNIAYRPLREEGKIVGMIQVAIDVTTQVMGRKKLEESESRFRAFVNASSDVVYRMNADWTEMQQLDGRGFLPDTSAPIPDWIEKYIHPDDRLMVKREVDLAVKEKKIFELEHRVLDAEGKLGWTYSKAIPILDDQGYITEWFGAASDISAQKEMQEVIRESEEKFRQLADLVPQIIWTGRADGFIDYYNKRWYEYTGFEEKTFGDESWIPIMHPDDVPLTMENWYGSVQAGTPFQLEFRLKHAATNEFRWFLSKAVPIRDKSGIINKWFGTSTDIHEQKTNTEKLEVLVAERTKELQRSNEDLQQFAHVASHDLKEPVRKIKTFTSRLEDQLKDKLDDTARRFINRIQVATDRMFTMIDGVLAYSTTNAGTQKPELVDINEIVKNIETDLEVLLQQKNASIRYSELPVLEGSPVLLYQLFYNLINNSLKFSKPGIPPRLIISSALYDDKGRGFARIQVQDNGIGFEQEQSEKIFETFTRLNPKDVYEGTGLGLALCKKIVDRHGGMITAAGKPNDGAVFVITLPVKQIQSTI